MQRTANLALVAVTIAGAATFLLPFILAVAPADPAAGSRTVDASLLLAVVVAGALVLATGEMARGSETGSASRSVALLGILVAIDASLRLVPSFFGASPIFPLIILVGYVFGARFGFAMGALTLLLSAALTAGIGPWLPFQMLCSAWIGAAAGWLPRVRSPWVEIMILALFGALAGLLFGLLINLYAWPFAAPGSEVEAGLYWYPGLNLRETLERYALFYATTSFVHDATRAVGNALLLVIAGIPVLRLLRRFQARATWTTVATDGRRRDHEVSDHHSIAGTAR